MTKPITQIPPLSNRWVLGGVALMITLQALFTYLPFMNTAFDSAPLPAVTWVPIVAIGVGALILVEVEKLLTRKRRSNGPREARSIRRGAA